MNKQTKNRLSLDKTTIAQLSPSELGRVAGGQRPNTQFTQCAQIGCVTTTIQDPY